MTSVVRRRRAGTARAGARHAATPVGTEGAEAHNECAPRRPEPDVESSCGAWGSQALDSHGGGRGAAGRGGTLWEPALPADRTERGQDPGGASGLLPLGSSGTNCAKEEAGEVELVPSPRKDLGNEARGGKLTSLPPRRVSARRTPARSASLPAAPPWTSPPHLTGRPQAVGTDRRGATLTRPVLVQPTRERPRPHTPTDPRPSDQHPRRTDRIHDDATLPAAQHPAFDDLAQVPTRWAPQRWIGPPAPRRCWLHGFHVR
jgi:hypothetical protein